MWDKADRAIDEQTGRRARKSGAHVRFRGSVAILFCACDHLADVSDEPQVDGASDAFVKVVLSGSVVASVTC
jgi:hypothetical protein